MALRTWAIASVILQSAHAVAPQGLPSNFPHDYPGKPTGTFGPNWQDYFQVTAPLPNVTFELGRSFAGNIPVQRAGHPNNTLFFWGFERENGSLTAAAGERSDEPWAIWLQGGPGSSSLFGLLFENGPLHIQNDYSAFANNYSWNKFADYIWIDQPAGAGFSTVDSTGYVANEEMVADDFMGFLENLVKVFPSLATRPLVLSGESYAGVYIPYISKKYFEMQDPPVKLSKIVIGNGLIGSDIVGQLLPSLSILETFPQIIGYNPAVYDYFKEQHHLCGYDLNLSYPQHGTLPTLQFIQGDIAGSSSLVRKFNTFTKSTLLAELRSRYSARSISKRDTTRMTWKRDFSDRANGTIDPWYGCDLFGEVIDYAVNFTFPWTLAKSSPLDGFDIYNIPDALFPEAPRDASVFLNNNTTRAAIHAPTSKDWELSFPFPFGNQEDPSVEPMAFLSDLATNATAHGVAVIFYSGNNDYILAHRGTEVIIQNTTFGGIQGFTQKPSQPWFDGAGNYAGIVHQERNWTYALVDNAGHLVPYTNPSSAYVFVGEFVFGRNDLARVNNASGSAPGHPEIFYGSGITQSSFLFPTATVAAWEKFIQTATASVSSQSAADGNNVLIGTFIVIVLSLVLTLL